jgi:hypothetical protein
MTDPQTPYIRRVLRDASVCKREGRLLRRQRARRYSEAVALAVQQRSLTSWRTTTGFGTSV